MDCDSAQKAFLTNVAIKKARVNAGRFDRSWKRNKRNWGIETYKTVADSKTSESMRKVSLMENYAV